MSKTHGAPSKGEPTLYLKISDLLKLTHVYLNHAPRHEKYGICNRILNQIYALYEIIVECQKHHFKKTALRDADVAHEKVRMLFKLYFELGYFHYKHHKLANNDREALRRYDAISALVNEVGAMIGGWINKVKADEK